MSEHTCKRCGETKAADDMITRQGKPASLCRECFGASFRKGGSKKAGKSRKVKSLEEVVERRTKAPKPVKLNGHLEVEQTYGFRAAWEDGYLAIEQDQAGENGEDVTARLLLTRSDVQRIAEWARA